MNARVDHLIDEALALPPEERSAVALALLDSLGGEDEAAVSAAWADEVRRRRQELRSGSVRAVPWDEAKVRLSVGLMCSTASIASPRRRWCDRPTKRGVASACCTAFPIR